eukprot:763627-Hanusia_phi.AAC.4
MWLTGVDGALRRRREGNMGHRALPLLTAHVVMDGLEPFVALSRGSEAELQALSIVADDIHLRGHRRLDANGRNLEHPRHPLPVGVPQRYLAVLVLDEPSLP